MGVSCDSEQDFFWVLFNFFFPKDLVGFCLLFAGYSALLLTLKSFAMLSLIVITLGVTATLWAPAWGWDGFQGFPWRFLLPSARIKLGRKLCVQRLQEADMQFPHYKWGFHVFPLLRQYSLSSAEQRTLPTAKCRLSSSAVCLPFSSCLSFAIPEGKELISFLRAQTRHVSHTGSGLELFGEQSSLKDCSNSCRWAPSTALSSLAHDGLVREEK